MFILLIGGGFAFAAKLPNTEPDYTKGEKLPIRWKPISDSMNCGPIGAIAHCWARPDSNDPTHESRMLLLREILEGSPADGKLLPDDVVIGVISPKIPPYRPYNWIPRGQPAVAKSEYVDATIFPYDVRKALAAAITEAEKKENDGKLVLNIWREGKAIPVALRLPVMGSYSQTTPFNCEKTERLITLTADRIVERKIAGFIPGSLDALGLLATGEEKYIKVLRDWVRSDKSFDPKDTEIPRQADGWSTSYRLIFAAEYYLKTKDSYVLPSIERMAMTLVKGQSFAGTWSHGMALPELNYGRDHGITAAYGSMNSVTGSCTVGLILARRAGVSGQEIDVAIDKSLNFLAYFSERGTVPYGDHTPWMRHNENNGKNSQAAVLFDLAEQKEEARYFTRMTLASHRGREMGHTGHYWSFIWGQIGAARGGNEAAHSFAANMNWFHELERRPDNDYSVQPQLRYGHWKTRYWSTAGMRLMGLCIPRKEIYLTGKGGNSFEPIIGEELVHAVETGVLSPSDENSVEELLGFLSSFSPIVREYAGIALGNKDQDVVDKLIDMLLRSDDPDTRRGAATALSFAGRGSEKAVDALLQSLNRTEDQVLKHFIVRAFHAPTKGNALSTSDAVRKAVPELFKLASFKDPKDPTSKLHSEIAQTLFDGREALAFQRGKNNKPFLEDVDHELIVAALKSLLSNINGYTRGWASRVFDTLSDEELEPLWRDIYLASLVPSPSGVMNNQQVMTNGVKLMADRNIKEGIILAAIQSRRPGWGKMRRTKEMAETLPQFGADAMPYFNSYTPWLRSKIEGELVKANKDEVITPKEQREIDQWKKLLDTTEASFESKKLDSIGSFLKPEDLKLTKEMFEYYPPEEE